MNDRNPAVNIIRMTIDTQTYPPVICNISSEKENRLLHPEAQRRGVNSLTSEFVWDWSNFAQDTSFNPRNNDADDDDDNYCSNDENDSDDTHGPKYTIRSSTRLSSTVSSDSFTQPETEEAITSQASSWYTAPGVIQHVCTDSLHNAIRSTLRTACLQTSTDDHVAFPQTPSQNFNLSRFYDEAATFINRENDQAGSEPYIRWTARAASDPGVNLFPQSPEDVQFPKTHSQSVTDIEFLPTSPRLDVTDAEFYSLTPRDQYLAYQDFILRYWDRFEHAPEYERAVLDKLWEVYKGAAWGENPRITCYNSDKDDLAFVGEQFGYYQKSTVDTQAVDNQDEMAKELVAMNVDGVKIEAVAGASDKIECGDGGENGGGWVDMQEYVSPGTSRDV